MRLELRVWPLRRLVHERLRGLRHRLHHVRRRHCVRLHVVPIVHAIPVQLWLHCGLPAGLLRRERLLLRRVRLHVRHLQQRRRQWVLDLPYPSAPPHGWRVYMWLWLPRKLDGVHADR